MDRRVITKPKKQKSYVSGGSDSGKPCPTCYAPMSLSGKSWTCPKHGEATRP